MITFILSLAALVLGYIFYGRFVERVFGPDESVMDMFSNVAESFSNNLIVEDRYMRITHSEQSAVTALDFMVEKMTATPLSDSQRTALSNECRQVIEEPTKRGFRVKLII